jgi:hypothetical protein
MVRLAMALGLTGLLAACGGGTTTTVDTKSTSITTTDGNSVTETSLGGAAAQNCAAKPDFAPVYPGATIVTCGSGNVEATAKDSGSIIYKTSASPATVIAFAKAETAKSGLTPGMDMPTMYSAIEGTKRTTMTVVEPDGSGSRVVLTWGKSAN